MIKIKNKTKFALLILLSPIAIIIILLIASFVTTSISNHFENRNFISLDRESRSVYEAIRSVAAEDEKWIYNTGCGNNYAGPWADGTYQCVAISYMEKFVSNADEVLRLHEKYYSIINGQNSLVAKSSLEFIHSDTFGKKFVVSSAERVYDNKKTGIYCRYESYLGQEAPNIQPSSDNYGSLVLNDRGTITIMLRCEGKTGGTWYPKIKDASGMIPDFTPYL